MIKRSIIINYERNDYSISYLSREKSGDLIFFIHGLGCSKDFFLEAFSYVGLIPYSILAIDLPGCGDSSMTDSFSCDLLAHAEICLRVLSVFPTKRIHLVGHSMGGAIALLLADMIPKRLASFVNVEGNLVGHDCTVSRKTHSHSFEYFCKTYIPALILTNSLSDEPGRRMWSDYIRLSEKTGLFLSSQSLVKWSESGLLLRKFKELDCPKVYVYGEKNSLLHVLSLLGMIRRFPVSGSGHFPMNDNPSEFYQYLSDYYHGLAG